MLFSIIALSVTGLVFIYWLINLITFINGLKNDHKLETNTYNKNPANNPLVSVIIPVRNEENNIANCLNGLVVQDYENLEIIVLNDNSTDKTEEIALEYAKKDNRVKVINGKQLPEGWKGKNHALHQGALNAKGDWLLFIDADTVHAKESIRQCLLHAQKKNIEMLTLFGTQGALTFWEKVVQPIISMLNVLEYRFSKVNNPENEKATANGQFIMIKKSAYDKVGGYEAIKNEMLDDIEMSRLLKRNGVKINIAWTSTLLHTRMYTKLSEIWEGYSKNLLAAFDNNAFAAIFGFLMITLGYALPIYGIIHSSILLKNFKSLIPLTILSLNSISFILISIVRFKVCRTFKMKGSFFLYQPISVIFILILILWCIFKSFFKIGLSWKGRTYKK